MTLSLTEEQARETVEFFGTVRGAARATGVSPHALRYRIFPRTRERARYHSDRQYEQLSGLEYSRQLLRSRRYKALRRKAEREQRRH